MGYGLPPMDKTYSTILTALRGAAGSISGEELCQSLGTTRAALWKQIQSLRGMGYVIDSAPRRGYRLASSPDTPYPWEVSPGLRTSRLGRVLEFHDSIVSTNQRVAEAARTGAPEGMVAVADTQTGGRGRMGRTWHSPPGKNLYFSVLFRPPLPPYRGSEISPVAAAALLRALATVCPGLDVQWKWPNDVLIGGRKLSGILCDMESEADRIAFLVVGIGVNVNSARSDFPTAITKVATSLAAESDQPVSRGQLMAAILNEFEAAYGQWLTEGLRPVLHELEKRSYLHGRTVTVETGGAALTGVVTGTSPQGGLRLRAADGRTVEVLSGDVHVRAIR